MRSRPLAWTALAGCLVALGAAAAPTYVMEFMASPGSGVVFTEHISWFSPMMLGYDDPFPLLASAVVTAMTIVALLCVMGRASSKALTVLAVVALVVIGADFVVFGSGVLNGSDHLRGLALLVPGGALVALIASLLSLRAARVASA